MAAYISLCEYIASCGGGIRLYRSGGVKGDGYGELIAMDARLWHRAAPFRAMLVRDDAGRSLDMMAVFVGEAGYFGPAWEPDCNDLLNAIADELAGCPLYLAEDEAAMLEAENTAREAAETAKQREATMRNLAASAATQSGRVIPQNSVAVTGLFDAVVYLYAVPYVTKKGRMGESLYAKAFMAGSTKPAFHKGFASAGERDRMVNEFLQGELV